MNHIVIMAEGYRQTNRNTDQSIPITALRCNTLQYAAVRCSTLQYAAVRCSMLQYAAESQPLEKCCIANNVEIETNKFRYFDGELPSQLPQISCLSVLHMCLLC